MAIAYRDGSTAASTASSFTINAPAALAAGDVMVLFVVQRQNTLTTPSGWSALTGPVNISGGFSARMWCFTRVATSADVGASYTLAFSGSAAASAVIAAYSGVDTTTPVNASTTKNAGSASSTTSPTVTTTTANCAVVTWFGAWENASGTGTFTLSGGGVTQRVTAPAATSANSAAGDATQATAGVTSAVTGTLSSGSGTMGVITVALAPGIVTTPLNAGTANSEQALSGTLSFVTPTALHTATTTAEQTLAASLALAQPMAAGTTAEQTLAASLTIITAGDLSTGQISSEQVLAGSLTTTVEISSWVGDDDARLDVGLELGAWLWLEPTEVTPPAHVNVRNNGQVTAVMPAPTLADGVPVQWTPTVTAAQWGRLQIVVAGTDVTFWRGKLSRVLSYASNEPFGDADAALAFPQVTEYDDLSTIPWWSKGAEVTLRRRHPDGTHSIMWEGLLASEEPSRIAHCIGSNYQLDLYIKPRSFLNEPVDLGHRIASAINHRAKHHGFKGGRCVPVDTGIDTREPGAFDQLLTSFIQNILATATTDSGEQWTLGLDHPRTPVIRLKNTTTQHWTVDAGAPGVDPQLTKDYTQAENVEYGSGSSGDCIWENRKFPNLHPDTAPLYPLSLPSTFNPGDGQSGFAPFADELRDNGYQLDSVDTYLSSDSDEVERFQDDAGILVDGIVGPQTWNAAFDPGAHQGDLSGVYVAPLAEDKTVEPFLFNAQGAKTGDNPAWDPSKLRIEKMTMFGPRVSKKLGIKAAKQMLARDKDAAYVGTLVLGTDPAEGSRRDIQAGQNIKLRRYKGASPLLHIARAEWDDDAGTMTLTVDEKARDLLTVAEIHQRNRDVANPVGQPKTGWRSGTQVSDRVQWACEDGSGKIPFHAQFGGLWSVLRIPAAEDGQVAKTILAAGSGLTRPILHDLLTDPLPDSYHGYVVPGATEMAVAVFSRPVTANMLAGLLGNPLANDAAGDNPWDANADQLTEWGCQYAAGGPGQAGGYYPHSDPGDGSGTHLSGRFVDSAGWPFSSDNIPWLWVALYTVNTCYLGGRLYPGGPV